jgi:hypothetical protein
MNREQILQALRNADALAQQGDEQAAQDARRLAAMLQSARPAVQEPQISTAEDVGRSFAGGAVQGTEGLINLPGQLQQAGLGLAARGLERIGTIEDAEAFLAQANQGLGNIRLPFGLSPRFGQVDLGAASEALVGEDVTQYEPQTVAGEYAQTAGEFLPGAVATPGGLLARLGYGVAAPALASETAGQAAQALGAGETGESIARLAGAVAGPAAAERGLRGLISPMAGAADDTARRAAETLSREGVPVTAGQQAQSTTLMGLEDALAPSPEQLEDFSRAVLRTIGAEGSRASDDVLDAARRRIGGVFDDVTQNLQVNVQPYRASQLQTIADEYRQIAADAGVSPLIGNIADAVQSGGALSSRQLMTWRSRLSRLSNSNDSATRQSAIEALEAVDNIIDDSLRAAGQFDAVDALSEARRQWRDYLAIERAATGAAGRGSGGLITPEMLGSAVIQQSRRQYATGGRGDLGDLARAGDRLLRQTPSVLPGGVRYEGRLPRALGTAAGGGIGAFVGNVPGAALGGLIGGATPELMGAAVRSAPLQAYLRNQLVAPYASRLSPAQRAIIYGPGATNQ